MADADGLMQVLTNLISNAAKFSPEASACQVSVPRHLVDCYRITVADRGPGIPEEFRDRIFEKFAQADSSDTRRKAGTGLGLSIVREIVVALDGSVGFEDRDGGGTLLPRRPAGAAGQSPRHRRGARPERREATLPRILHVDDDPLIRRLVAKALMASARRSIHMRRRSRLREPCWRGLFRSGDP